LLEILSKSVVTSESSVKNSLSHSFQCVELKPEEFDNLVSALITIVPDHYIAPDSVADILERLGKGAAAQKLRDKIPEVKKIRSGDIGEIVTTDFIDESTDFFVPIRKLRWRDHRNMAMRGDDLIGICINRSDQTVCFLKAEAKSYKSINNNALSKARTELDNDGGLPAPHALGFVIDRLKDIGKDPLAHLLEKAQLVNGINTGQVEHMLFVLTASNPASLQKDALFAYEGEIKQSSVGFRVSRHQDFIAQVYQGVLDGLDS
jgi:hypothetical protein